MQNSVSPCPLKMKVYHNYKINKAEKIVPIVPDLLNFLKVTPIVMVGSIHTNNSILFLCIT